MYKSHPAYVDVVHYHVLCRTRTPRQMKHSCYSSHWIGKSMSALSHYGIASRWSHNGVTCVPYESHGLWKQRCKGHGERFAICTTTHAQKCDMTIVLLCRCALHCQSSHSKHNGFVCWHWRFGHKCTVYNHCSDCTWKHEMQSHHTGRTVHTLWNLVATFCYVSEDCLKATVDHWDQCSRLQRSA